VAQCMDQAIGRAVLVLSAVVAAASVTLEGCRSEAQTAAPAPPEVMVVEARRAPATAYNEYVAQTQAPDTIEIRSQVTGLLERQAFADGARVKKGDVLYVIDQRPFEAQRAQAKAALAQAQANLTNARQNLARNERLIAENAVSRQDYDSAVAQERATQAVVDAQAALLRSAEINLEFTTIRAPRDGFMSSSMVKPGGLVGAQQTLLDTLYSTDPMWVYLTISEERLLQLQKQGKRPDASTPFRIKLADGTDYAMVGKLDFVDSTIDPKSGTLQVRVSVPNPDRLLRPGLFVRVGVPALDAVDAIRIPQQAVTELQGTKTVFVIGAGDKVEARQIVADRRIGNEWIVASGLVPGDRVVVEGAGKVKSGAHVSAVTAAAVASAVKD
jgi:membrane fusion protein (multidrug efflux system)